MWKAAMRLVVLTLWGVTWLGVLESEAQGIGYVLAGPVGVSGFYGRGTTGHVGVGGELLLRNQFAIGAEIGLMSYAAVFAVNGGAHFVRDRSRRLVPFASGGYVKWSSNEGSFDGMNVAAGADYWFKQRLGMRIEVRDHIRPDSRGTVQYWSFRAGVAFR